MFTSSFCLYRFFFQFRWGRTQIHLFHNYEFQMPRHQRHDCLSKLKWQWYYKSRSQPEYTCKQIQKHVIFELLEGVISNLSPNEDFPMQSYVNKLLPWFLRKTRKVIMILRTKWNCYSEPSALISMNHIPSAICNNFRCDNLLQGKSHSQGLKENKYDIGNATRWKW